MKVLFVASNRTLTESQKEGWDKIIYLSEIDPQLQKTVSSINPNATLYQIQLVAKAVVDRAVLVKSTHVYFEGDPSWVFWANLYASPVRLQEQIEPGIWSSSTYPAGLIPVIPMSSEAVVEYLGVTSSEEETEEVEIFEVEPTHLGWRELF